MTIHRRLAAGVAAGVVASILFTGTAGADTTPAEEQTRTAIATYLQNLQSAVTAASQNPVIGAAVTAQLGNLNASLASAQAQVPNLTGPALDAAANILSQTPTWQQQPVLLQQDLSLSPTRAPSQAVPAGFLSDCTASLGDPRGLFYGYWAAAQVASAANAVASGIPSAVDFTALTIIAGVAFGVANGIAIALQGNLTLAADCTLAVQNAALAATYPTDPSSGNPGHLTPASSQISVNQLATIEAGIQNTLDTIQTEINVITTKLTTAINLVGVGQGTANNIQSVAIDLQNRSDLLLNNIGTATDQASDPGGGVLPSGTANGLANTINTREVTTLANTAAFQALSIRMEIESQLASGANPVSTFELPASQGGYLQTVQSIVTQTAAAEAAAGQGQGQAQADIAAGNAALAAGQFLKAYWDYQGAYVQATK